jgi:hypothetical protein
LPPLPVAGTANPDPFEPGFLDRLIRSSTCWPEGATATGKEFINIGKMSAPITHVPDGLRFELLDAGFEFDQQYICIVYSSDGRHLATLCQVRLSQVLYERGEVRLNGMQHSLLAEKLGSDKLYLSSLQLFKAPPQPAQPEQPEQPEQRLMVAKVDTQARAKQRGAEVE